MCSFLRAHTFIDVHERTSNLFLVELSKRPAPPVDYSGAEAFLRGRKAFLRGRKPFHSSYGKEWYVWDWSRSAGLSKDLRKALVVIQSCWLDTGGSRIKHAALPNSQSWEIPWKERVTTGTVGQLGLCRPRDPQDFIHVIKGMHIFSLFHSHRKSVFHSGRVSGQGSFPLSCSWYKQILPKTLQDRHQPSSWH